MNSIRISRPDCKIAAHAINWTVNVPFDHTAQPALTEEQSDRLNSMAKHFVGVLESNEPSVELFVTREESSDQVGLRFGPEDYALLVIAVSAFFKELANSPSEVEIVTGFPAIALKELVQNLARLNTI